MYLGNRPQAVVLQPVPEDHLEESVRGSLYAMARNPGGIQFEAVAGADGRVEGMEMEPAAVARGDKVNLSRWTQLLNRASFEEDPTGPAGWRLG